MSRLIAMARPRSQFLGYWNASKDSTIEHITKLVVFASDRPEDIRGWKVTLNKYIPRLRLLNSSTKGVHFTKEKLYKDMASEYTLDYIQLLCDEASEIGYPPRIATTEDIKKMLVILDNFCTQVLTTGGKIL